MAETTKIAWATSTWNPWIGCSKVHTGCEHCYAERDFAIRRKKVEWGLNGTRVKTSDAYWRKPFAWDKKAEAAGERWRVFPSLCDPFEAWFGYADDGRGGDCTLDELRFEMFELIDRTPNLDWLLCTKRPSNIWSMWQPSSVKPWADRPVHLYDNPHPLRRENVWLIYSASDQGSLDQGVGSLLKCRNLVPVIGLSLEPLVDAVNLGDYLHALDWVIIGGESGPEARRCYADWVRRIVKQCKSAGVPCFVKQLGAVVHDLGMTSADHVEPCECWPDKTRTDHHHVLLKHPKGGDLDEWPTDLRVREFPKCEVRHA